MDLESCGEEYRDQYLITPLTSRVLCHARCGEASLLSRALLTRESEHLDGGPSVAMATGSGAVDVDLGTWSC